MVSNLSLRLAALVTLTLGIGALPADAIVGSLSGYSAHQIRHLTSQAEVQSKHHKGGHRPKLRRALSYLGRAVQLSRHNHMPPAAPDLHLSSASQARVSRPADTRVFLNATPAPDLNQIDADEKERIGEAFATGRAERYSPRLLADAQVFAFDALKGSVFNRRESIKYIILHSTETAHPADAQRVISSWNNRGKRHAGAQFIVDRDGIIYNTVDPQFATVHVDTRRTKYGVNNDNSIGIEIVHTGNQEYTDKQVNSVACLVTYLQSHYGVSDGHVYTHHYVQPSDRSDPVAFDWDKFASDKTALSNGETALERRSPGVWGGG